MIIVACKWWIYGTNLGLCRSRDYCRRKSACFLFFLGIFLLLTHNHLFPLIPLIFSRGPFPSKQLTGISLDSSRKWLRKEGGKYYNCTTQGFPLAYRAKGAFCFSLAAHPPPPPRLSFKVLSATKGHLSPPPPSPMGWHGLVGISSSSAFGRRRVTRLDLLKMREEWAPMKRTDRGLAVLSIKCTVSTGGSFLPLPPFPSVHRSPPLSPISGIFLRRRRHLPGE